MTETPSLPVYFRRQGEFDPDPVLAAVRDGAGVVRVPAPFVGDVQAWLVTRLDDVRAVLSDPVRFSNVIPPGRFQEATLGVTEEELERSRAGNPLAYDPPEHTRLRRMLTPAFTVRQMRLLEPRIAAIVADHLDALEVAGPPADLVAGFALPVPSLVICELLGVSYDDRVEFQRRSNRLLDLSLPPRERIDALAELRAFMRTLVAREREEPGDRLLGDLVRRHGDDLSEAELAGIGSILLVAGHETTANMLGLGTLALLRHPDQLRLLREQPGLVEAGVEELLRWLSIVAAGLARITTERVEIAGVTIEAGELVFASLPAADRDPALVPDPDVLDVTRGEIGHLAFGHGVHHCLGAPLARAELRIALPALLERFPGLRLLDPDAQVAFRTTSLVYGPSVLPVTW